MKSQGLIKLMFLVDTGMNKLHRGMLGLLLLNALYFYILNLILTYYSYFVYSAPASN